MTAVEAALDAYLDANVLIIVAFGFWWLMGFAQRRLGMGHMHRAQLQLLNGMFVIILATPVVLMVLGQIQSAGYARGFNVNLSDLVVSQFLAGTFEMRATDLESALTLRDRFIGDVTAMRGWLGQGVVAALAIGLLVGTCRLAFSACCLHRILRASHVLRRFGRVQVRVSDGVLVPFTTRGIWFYHVVVPSHMLARGDEMRVSLAHEFQHIRQGDIEWEILLEVLKPLFFINPAYHACKRRVEALRELTCDQQVIARGRIDTRSYCETLMSVCQQTLRRDRSFVVAFPKVTLVSAERTPRRRGGLTLLEQRIEALFSQRVGRQGRALVLVGSLWLMLAVQLTAMAIQKPSGWSHDRIMLSTVVNLERLDQINQSASLATPSY